MTSGSRLSNLASGGNRGVPYLAAITSVDDPDPHGDRANDIDGPGTGSFLGSSTEARRDLS